MKNLLFQNEEFLSGLGLTILNSLWLVTIVVVIAFVLLKLFKLTAKEKYDLIFTTQILALSSVVFLFFWAQHSITNTIVPNADDTIGQLTEVNNPASEIIAPEKSFQWNGQLLSRYLGCFWLAGLLLLTTWKFMNWRFTMRLRKNGLLTIPEHWQKKFNLIAEKMDFDRRIVIHTSAKVVGPMMIGYLKPMILVPIGFFSDLAPAEIEAIILHELAHIKRRDYLHLLIQQIINLILFYHPAIWLLDKMAKQERENACDDYVVGITGDPKTYVKALGTMQLNFSKTQNKMAMNLLNDKNAVLNRLKRLVGEEPRQKVSGKFLVLPAILLISVILLSFSSQTDKTPETDTISKSIEYLQPDYTHGDTSIITLQEVKPIKVKEKQQKGKSKIKVVEVKDEKINADELIEIVEVKEELPEIIEVIIEQPEKMEGVVSEKEVQEVVIEEVPEVEEVISEQPQEIRDTIPLAEREELLMLQLKELREKYERLQAETRAVMKQKKHDVIQKEQNEAVKAQIQALKEREIAEKYKREAEQIRMKAELAKVQAEVKQRMALVEKERALAMRSNNNNRVNYDKLISIMNEDGLKIKQGDKIKFKVDKQNVYLDGIKLSDKLANRYRKLLHGYIGAGGDAGTATVIITPKQTDISFKKN